MTKSYSSKSETCRCGDITADATSVQKSDRYFDGDAKAWLVGQAIAGLNADDPEGRIGSHRATELLAAIGAVDAVEHVYRGVPHSDVALRWSLLYVLAETRDLKAGKFFAGIAGEAIPFKRDARACESPYDGEVLVRTMAIEGLARSATREKAHVDLLYDVLHVQDDRALRIEAIKAIRAAAPDDVERLRKTVPEDLHFAIDLKIVRAQSLGVEYEGKQVETVARIPSLDKASKRPATRTCSCC